LVKTKQIMPTTYLLVAILAMAALYFLFPGPWIVPPWWNLVGLVPLGLGIVLNLIADRAFHQANTTVKPFQESAALITKGAFQISRNPMYLGFVLILVGIAVLMRSLTPFVIVIAFAVLMDRMYIQAEERMLAERFGPAWETYRKRTRRWL
jgi:protein-S-isoprenylcysteine O-methyltransferase Ste14